MSKKRVRMAPGIRKDDLIKRALELAKEVGYLKVTCISLAEACGCSTALVFKYYGTMTQLRRDILRHAIKTKCQDVINQGVAMKDIINK